jgi:hypothetical protein
VQIDILGAVCQPGQAGGTLTQTNNFSGVAGRWVPASIVAIQHTGRNSASADVRMTFEPRLLLQAFEDAFDSMESPSSLMASHHLKTGEDSPRDVRAL